ncbi:MAG: tRNA threonylcarbamoyladenosine dehydratase [Bacteroidaceae bacterium]|jgi:tRNA A37 threonylcarbamoyladenosine dehydratase|nr:tRNA threonylcarbamoyladenosine dehydratase [Bacteroidaceae bacterium]
MGNPINNEENDWQQRTRLLYGAERMNKLRAANILIVGLGGVGAYAAEMLCRAGIGHLQIVDADRVTITNINRQLPALHSTVGQMKAKLLASRFQDINPEIDVNFMEVFLDEENMPTLFENNNFDFVVDAIDTVSCKCKLMEACLKNHIPLISAMGAGAKTDIRRIRVESLWKTTQCGLAKVVRATLRRDGFSRYKVPVVFSDEPVHRDAILLVDGERNKKSTAGTVSYMTATFGNYLSWYVLEHL